MGSDGFLLVSLSPDSHPSLDLSCADKLLWFFAEQILRQRELAIAYPCLNCRGGLSIFLAYLAIAMEENPPGQTPDPILVYPGTVEIRESYTGLKVQIGDLLEALRQRRVRAGRGCFVHRWEQNLLRGLQRGRISKTAVFPLHDFFPAAMLDDQGLPRIFAGRDGFGRGDDSPPPLQFAAKLLWVSSRVRYRVAVIMHDNVESRSERQRLHESLDGIQARSLIHLFESPYSPTFRRMMTADKPCWRLRPDDFVSKESPVPADEEVVRILGAERRIHSVPALLSAQEYDTLAGNFRELRQIARGSPEAAEAYTYLYSCYRLIIILPVPTEHYDAVADQFGLSTLSERIDDIKEIAEPLGPGVAYSLVDASVQTLYSLLDRIRANPVRSHALLVEVRRASREGKRLGIVVSSPIFASVIERFLAKELECETLALPDKQIHVIEARTLPYLKPFDVLVFFGYRGAGDLRWIMSGRSKQVVALVTEGERRAMSWDLKAGSRGRDSWGPQRTSPSGQFGGGESAGEGETEPDHSAPAKQLEEALGDAGTDLPTLPLDDDQFLREILDYSPPVGAGSSKAAAGIMTRTCRMVIFRDQYAYLPAEGSVTVLATKGTSEKRVENLTVGEIILFIDGGQRRSIYELMLAEIKKSPAFTASADIVQAWHRRLKAEFSESILRAADIHRLLQREESKVVGATVAGWLRGDVMSPQDSENLRRLMRVLEIPDPDGKHSRRIDQAAKHLRNVYRQYARAVNAFLLRAAGDDRPELDALLEKYNLDIDAIREAVVTEEVEEISSDSVEIPISMTGRLYDR